MDTPDNKQGQVIEITTRQPEQPERMREIRSLPAGLYTAVMIAACQMKADGASLDDVTVFLAEKFNVRTSKAGLSHYFRNKWADEVKRQIAVCDARLETHWIARQVRRISFYQLMAEQAAAAGEFTEASKIAFLAARELGQVVEKRELTGLVKHNHAIEVSFGDEGSAVKPWWTQQQPPAQIPA